MAKEPDPRVVMAHALAQRSLTHGNVNDCAKAILLLTDHELEADPTKTDIGKAAAEGREPELFGRNV